MPEEENRALFRRTYEELLNAGDLSVADELVAPEFVNHEAPPGRDRGSESMRGLAAMLRTAFPDLHFEIEDLVAEGDMVAGRLTMSGTHEGPLMGTPPTGRAVRQDHMHFVRFGGGQGRGALGREGRPRDDAPARPRPGAGRVGPHEHRVTPYSPKCLEGVFSELRLGRVLPKPTGAGPSGFHKGSSKDSLYGVCARSPAPRYLGSYSGTGRGSSHLSSALPRKGAEDEKSLYFVVYAGLGSGVGTVNPTVWKASPERRGRCWNDRTV